MGAGGDASLVSLTDVGGAVSVDSILVVLSLGADDAFELSISAASLTSSGFASGLDVSEQSKSAASPSPSDLSQRRAFSSAETNSCFSTKPVVETPSCFNAARISLSFIEPAGCTVGAGALAALAGTFASDVLGSSVD